MARHIYGIIRSQEPFKNEKEERMVRLRFSPLNGDKTVSPPVVGKDDGGWEQRIGLLFVEENGVFKTEPIPKNISDLSVIGTICGTTYPDFFAFMSNRQWEDYAGELSFIRTVFRGTEYFGQVIKVFRESKNNSMVCHVNIMGKPPNIAFDQYSKGSAGRIFRANPSQVEKVLGFDPKGYYIGNIINTNIAVKLNSVEGEDNAYANGVIGLGVKSSGKTVACKVSCEEKLLHNEAVFWLDQMGEALFNFPNTKEPQVSRLKNEFGLSPRTFPQLVFAFESNEKLVPFATAVLPSIDVLDRDSFYNKFIKRGVVTIVSVEGLSKEDAVSVTVKIANSLKRLGEAGVLPSMLFVCDEAHELAPQQGKTLASEYALVDMSKKAGHHGIGTYFLTQRLASLSKNLTTPQGGYVIGSLVDKNDLEKSSIAPIFKNYLPLIMKLGQGQALIRGLTKNTLPINIRPTMTQHFRLSAEAKQAAKNHPEMCNVDSKIQREVDDL